MDEIAIDFAERADYESDDVHVTLQNIDGPLFLPLSEVLHYPELYEAYPQLAKVKVYQKIMPKHTWGHVKKGFVDSITINSEIADWNKESSLLHEVQHLIQEIEGFAKGANDRNGMDAYMRSAGEIEARNVEKRMDWSAARREATPFNNTLEYPGEALVSFSIQSIMTDWHNTLHGYLNNPPVPGSPEHARDMVVCPTPAVMQMVGAKGLDMVVTPGVLDKVMKGKHAVSAWLRWSSYLQLLLTLFALRCRILRDAWRW